MQGPSGPTTKAETDESQSALQLGVLSLGKEIRRQARESVLRKEVLFEGLIGLKAI